MPIVSHRFAMQPVATNYCPLPPVTACYHPLPFVPLICNPFAVQIDCFRRSFAVFSPVFRPVSFYSALFSPFLSFPPRSALFSLIFQPPPALRRPTTGGVSA